MLLPVVQVLPKTKGNFESYTANYITGVQVREITLKDLVTKHLFKIKALINLEVFNGEQLNSSGSGTYTFLSFTKAFVVHTSFSTAWQRQDGGRNPSTYRVFLVPAEPC